MKTTTWLGLLLVTLSIVHDSLSCPSPQSPALRLVGRFDTQSAEGPRFGWPGSQIIARFRGTQVSLRLRDASSSAASNTYTVVIDGAAPLKIACNATAERYPLARDLAPGEHTVTVFRNTEAFLGEAQLLGFDFGPDGALLAPPPRPARRIELIGDSITAGYGNEGPSQHCTFSAATENGYLAYGAVAARILDVDATMIAWSGRGVSRNRDGATTGVLAELYPRVLPLRPESVVPASERPADAVIINLSANDFKQGVPEEETFLKAYANLIQLVRTKNPHAPLLCTLGPTITDAFPRGETRRSIAKRYIEKAVRDATLAGDAQVFFLEFPEQKRSDGFGCDYHPSIATHQAMGERLAATLHAAWSTQAPRATHP